MLIDHRQGHTIPDEKKELGNYLLLKIHSRQVINSQNFPQLTTNDELTDDEKGDVELLTTDVFSYVLLLMETKNEVTVTLLNKYIKLLWAQRLHNYVDENILFPATMTNVNNTINGLLITRYGEGQLIESNADILHASPLPMAAATAAFRKDLHDYSRVLPWLSQTAPTVTFELVVSYLDFNDIIYGLNQVNHSVRAEPSLKSSLWWRNRMRDQWGAAVVRWSDDTMARWADAYATTHPESVKMNDPVTTASVSWRQWPLWYAAAVHLQCRLNRYRHDIFHVQVEQRDPTYKAPSTTYSRGRRRPRYDIPTPLRDFLLLAPPFMPPPTRLSRKHAMWTTRSDLKSLDLDAAPAADSSRYVAWIGVRDNDDEPHCLIGLYLGPVFAFEDESNVSLGRAASVLKAEEYNSHHRVKSDVGKRVREFYHVDADSLPVIGWELDGDEISIKSNSLDAFLNKVQSEKMKRSLIVEFDKKARNENGQRHRDAADTLEQDGNEIQENGNYMNKGVGDDTAAMPVGQSANKRRRTSEAKTSITVPQVHSVPTKYCLPRMEKRLNYIIAVVDE